MRSAFTKISKSVFLALTIVFETLIVAPSVAEAATPPKGNELFSFTTTNAGRPLGLAFNEQGQLLVAQDSGGIDVFDRCGNFLFNFFEGNKAVNIAVNKDGQIITTNSRRVFVFNPKGELLFNFDAISGALPIILGVAVDEGGRIYVLGGRNFEFPDQLIVRVFDSCGNFIFEFGERVLPISSALAVDIAVTVDGHIIVADTGLEAEEEDFFVFNSEGTLLFKSDLGFNPEALAVNEAGQTLIFVENAGRVYDRCGNFLFDFQTDISKFVIGGAAVSSDGLIAVSNSFTKEIKIFE